MPGRLSSTNPMDSTSMPMLKYFVALNLRFSLGIHPCPILFYFISFFGGGGGGRKGNEEIDIYLRALLPCCTGGSSILQAKPLLEPLVWGARTPGSSSVRPERWAINSSFDAWLGNKKDVDRLPGMGGNPNPPKSRVVRTLKGWENREHTPFCFSSLWGWGATSTRCQRSSLAIIERWARTHFYL